MEFHKREFHKEGEQEELLLCVVELLSPMLGDVMVNRGVGRSVNTDGGEKVERVLMSGVTVIEGQ